MDPRKRGGVGGGGGRETRKKQGWEQGVEGFGIRDTWGWGTARDFRETLRNRERRKLGNLGVGEVAGGGGVEVGERSETVGERKGRKGWQ